MTRRAVFIVIGSCVFAACGCGPGRSLQPPRPAAAVDVVNLRVMPNPVNLDNDPEPDALLAEVFFFKLDEPQPVPVTGTLELLLFEGNVPVGSLGRARPLRVWRFGGDDLRRCLTRDHGLWGYVMQLRWDMPPAAKHVTLLARYTRPGGGTVVSAPSSIPLRIP